MLFRKRPNGSPVVVHASSAHPWSDNRVHLREAASLARAGYDVRLIAVERQVDVPGTGVEVSTIPVYSRQLRVSVGTVRVIARAIRMRPDVVHLHDPELVWAVPLLRALRIRVVYDAHEDLPEQVAHKQYVSPRWRRAYIRLAGVVLWLASRSSMIVVATEQIGTRFPGGKTCLVRNYPQLRLEDDSAPPPSQRPRQVAYVGAITVNRGAGVMVDALASKSFPPDWRLVLAGQVVPAALMHELAAARGWSRAQYLGVVSPMRARDISSESRIGLCVLGSTPAHRASLPTKMFEYMASGTPVIVSDFPLWRAIVEEHECGLVVDEKSPEAVADAIRMYSENEELLDLHGKRARLAARTILNWSVEERSLIAGYRRVLKA